MDFERGLVVVVVIGVSIGCGDSGAPTASGGLSSSPASTGFSAGASLRVVSGETDGAVSGASFLAAGRSYVTDASGRLVLDVDVPGGADVTIRANGFLERVTRVRSSEQTTFALWPASGSTGIDADYTQALVYTSSTVDAPVPESLDRPALDTPRIAVVPDATIASDAAAMRTVELAVEEINRALEGAFTYSVGESAGAVPVELRVEPGGASFASANVAAFTRCWLNRLVIFRCEIVFRSSAIVRTETTLHELGHTFGLNHSARREEIMAVRRQGTPTTFSVRERLVMKMMTKRRPGNTFPDDDRQAPAQRTLGSESRVLCLHP